MKIFYLIIPVCLLIGCSSTHQHTKPPLTVEQATALSKELANKKAFELYHGDPHYPLFRYAMAQAQFVSGHWIWIGDVITPHGSYDKATVELARDGSTNRVDLIHKELGWLP